MSPKEWLDKMNMTVASAAKQIGIKPNKLSLIINNRQKITKELAEKFIQTTKYPFDIYQYVNKRNELEKMLIELIKSTPDISRHELLDTGLFKEVFIYQTLKKLNRDRIIYISGYKSRNVPKYTFGDKDNAFLDKSSKSHDQKFNYEIKHTVKNILLDENQNALMRHVKIEHIKHNQFLDRVRNFNKQNQNKWTRLLFTGVENN